MAKGLFELLESEADNEYSVIDSMSVRNQQERVGTQKKKRDESIGHNGGGSSARIHAPDNLTAFALPAWIERDGSPVYCNNRRLKRQTATPIDKLV